MNNINQNFCYSTLALGQKYRDMTKLLASDLAQYSPGTMLVVGSDQPSDFASCDNIIAFKIKQQGILHCYHDKRFVIEKALKEFPIVIQIDADVRIIKELPQVIEYTPGIIGGFHENLIPHVNKYTPERLERIKRIATKINLDLEQADFIGESLLIIAKDNGKEQEFLRQWGLIGKFLELRGIHAGSGNIIGMAALKVGWKASRNLTFEQIKKATTHLDASHSIKRSSWEQLKRRIAYHYRLNKARILALKDFDFYYR
jgi:hypothetical protein